MQLSQQGRGQIFQTEHNDSVSHLTGGGWLLEAEVTGPLTPLCSARSGSFQISGVWKAPGLGPNPHSLTSQGAAAHCNFPSTSPPPQACSWPSTPFLNSSQTHLLFPPPPNSTQALLGTRTLPSGPLSTSRGLLHPPSPASKSWVSSPGSPG